MERERNEGQGNDDGKGKPEQTSGPLCHCPFFPRPDASITNINHFPPPQNTDREPFQAFSFYQQ